MPQSLTLSVGYYLVHGATRTLYTNVRTGLPIHFKTRKYALEFRDCVPDGEGTAVLEVRTLNMAWGE